MVFIKQSNLNNIKEFAKIALNNQLYINDCFLKDCFINILDNVFKITSTDIIFLLKEKDEYIGCCVFLEGNEIPIQIYVKPKYTENKLSVKLVKNVLDSIPINKKKRVLFRHGEFQSFFFFHKLINLGLIDYENLNTNDQKMVRIIDLILFSDKNKINPSINDHYIMRDEAFCFLKEEMTILLKKITSKNWRLYLKKYHNSIPKSWFNF